MFDTVSTASSTCAFAISGRLAGPALLGLLLLALEAWLRMPLSLLLDFYLPRARARAASSARPLSS
jgi:hypothetical protein